MNNVGFPGLANTEANMSNFIAVVVEDDPIQRTFLADLLKEEGLEVVECASAEAAELVLVATGPELRALVTDVNLAGDMSGLELAQYAKRKFPRLNVVMISGRSVPYVPEGARFLRKP
jgi:DNA-binding NtrC family response regulator